MAQCLLADNDAGAKDSIDLPPKRFEKCIEAEGGHFESSLT